MNFPDFDEATGEPPPLDIAQEEQKITELLKGLSKMASDGLTGPLFDKQIRVQLADYFRAIELSGEIRSSKKQRDQKHSKAVSEIYANLDEEVSSLRDEIQNISNNLVAQEYDALSDNHRDAIDDLSGLYKRLDSCEREWNTVPREVKEREERNKSLAAWGQKADDYISAVIRVIDRTVAKFYTSEINPPGTWVLQRSLSELRRQGQCDRRG